MKSHACIVALFVLVAAVPESIQRANCRRHSLEPRAAATRPLPAKSQSKAGWQRHRRTAAPSPTSSARSRPSPGSRGGRRLRHLRLAAAELRKKVAQRSERRLSSIPMAGSTWPGRPSRFIRLHEVRQHGQGPEFCLQDRPPAGGKSPDEPIHDGRAKCLTFSRRFGPG